MIQDCQFPNRNNMFFKTGKKLVHTAKHFEPTHLT